MQSIFRRATRSLALATSLVLLAPANIAWADLLPSIGTFLTGFDGSTFSFVQDGTSNTIQFSEVTRIATCFDDVVGRTPLSGISDGSSNTIMFGSSLFLTLRVGTSLGNQPIGNIRDGTSNTIFFGEIAPDSRCFAGDTAIVDIGNAIVDGSSNTIGFDERSRFDVCFRDVRVGRITDGTSNTIVFGEPTRGPVCFEDVRLAASASLPEPGSLALVGLALVGLFVLRRAGSRVLRPRLSR